VATTVSQKPTGSLIKEEEEEEEEEEKKSPLNLAVQYKNIWLWQPNHCLINVTL
jgi:hypothetical protein